MVCRQTSQTTAAAELVGVVVSGPKFLIDSLPAGHSRYFASPLTACSNLMAPWLVSSILPVNAPDRERG
jgi:hypothetical protein